MAYTENDISNGFDLNWGNTPGDPMSNTGFGGGGMTGLEDGSLGTPQTFGQMGMAMPTQGVTEAAGDAGGNFLTNLLSKGKNGDFGSMQGWGTALGGLGDIGNAYMAYKNYGLAKDQFAFNKELTNRNMANQAALTNQRMASWSQARGMAPVTVDGSAIG